MQERERNDRLLDLGPRDLENYSPDELEALLVEDGVAKADAAREIRYLRQISRRQVRMPSDVYFAEARQKILQRVEISPRTSWNKLVSLLFPAHWRPLPATVAALLIAIAILTPMLYHPVSNVRVDLPPLEGAGESAGPYVSMSEVYTEHVVSVDEQVVSADELREYREILLMSTAILGSPSSLSRSRSLAGSHN